MSDTQGTKTGTNDIRTTVRERYGAIAEGKQSGCGCGCTTDDGSGCCGDGGDVLAQIGYSEAQAAAIPEGANLGLGCGNPIAHAAIRPGETVLDLGSGAGIDVFLAARETGPAGRVIGVDMTPAMLDKARANAAKAGVKNVEFRLGEIENLPLADASVDVVISNCVVNLSPDKPRVFREALRVLRPGGRAVVSDLVLLRPLADEAKRNVDLYVGCVAGALVKQDYLAALRDAGFRDVTVLEERGYTVGQDHLPEGSVERQAFEAVVSVKVRGVKP